MSDLDTIIINKLENVESDVSVIKVDIAKIQADVEYHIRRTDELQDLTREMKDIVTPLYEEFVSKKAINEYKKTQREDLLYKLKLPGYILAAITALGGALAWLVRK